MSVQVRETGEVTVGVGDEVEDFTIPAECSPLTNYTFFDGFESGDTDQWSSAVP